MPIVLLSSPFHGQSCSLSLVFPGSIKMQLPVKGVKLSARVSLWAIFFVTVTAARPEAQLSFPFSPPRPSPHHLYHPNSQTHVSCDAPPRQPTTGFCTRPAELTGRSSNVTYLYMVQRRSSACTSSVFFPCRRRQKRNGSEDIPTPTPYIAQEQIRACPSPSPWLRTRIHQHGCNRRHYIYPPVVHLHLIMKSL